MKRIILDGKESNYIISENGEVFNTFTNKEAARQLNCDGSAISRCCRGKYSNHHGYTFQYQ